MRLLECQCFILESQTNDQRFPQTSADLQTVCKTRHSRFTNSRAVGQGQSLLLSCNCGSRNVPVAAVFYFCSPAIPDSFLLRHKPQRGWKSRNNAGNTGCVCCPSSPRLVRPLKQKFVARNNRSARPPVTLASQREPAGDALSLLLSGSPTGRVSHAWRLS
jgi:hypothetical protein